MIRGRQIMNLYDKLENNERKKMVLKDAINNLTYKIQYGTINFVKVVMNIVVLLRA
jgi:hypothetical protein